MGSSIIDRIAVKIIQEQELIIGPIAWSEAGKVPGIQILSKEKPEISLNGDNKTIIDRLVSQYENIFGRASREVCREAAAPLVADLAPAEIPMSLK